MLVNCFKRLFIGLAKIELVSLYQHAHTNIPHAGEIDSRE